jgi:hypothetical protein
MDDAVAQANLPGALAGGTKKHLWCRRMGVLLEEVMLDQPDAVEPKSVGKLDLLEGVGQELLIVAGSPRSGQLMLVEQAETHEASLVGWPVSVIVTSLNDTIKTDTLQE